MTGHLPLCMYIHLLVDIMYFNDSRYFVPKPKWSSTNELMLSEYRHILDLSLQNINLPDDLFTCIVHCLLHRPVIERLHDDIIAALLNAAKCSIQFTTTNGIIISTHVRVGKSM